MKLRNKKIFWAFLCSYIFVILIPLVLLAGFFWPQLKRTAQKEAEITDLNNMKRIAQTMDTELAGVYTLPSRIFTHPKIILSEVMESSITQRNARMELSDILGINTFTEFCMLYMRDDDYFISVRVPSFYFDDFYKYPGVFQMQLGVMPLDELHELLETIDSNRVFYADAVGLSGNQYEDSLMFLMPVPNYRGALATCVVCVSTSQLDLIAQPVTMQNGMVAFIEPQGSIAYATSPETAPIIAKFEQDISFSSKPVTQVLLSGTDKYIVTSAKSARYGWKYITLTPMASVIAESRKIQQRTTAIILIVVTLCSVSVFLAMKLNYVPIHRLSALADQHGLSIQGRQNEFTQIRNLIVSLHLDKQNTVNTLNTTQLHMRDLLLTRILCGNEQEVQDALMRASILKLDTFQPQWQVLLAQYANDQDAHAARTLINSIEGLMALRIDKASQLVCIRTGAMDEVLPVDMLKLLGNPQKLTVSGLVEDISKLGSAYATTCATLDYFTSSDMEQSILYCSEMPERFYNPRFYPLDVMQALDTAITHGSYNRMTELMQQIEILLAVEGAPPYYTRSVYYSVVSLLINGLRQYSSDSDEVLTELTLMSAIPRYTVREMREILHGTAEKLATMMQQHEAKASPWSARLQYIDQHLSSPTLSLQDVADQAGMSVSAFSRAFKENVGKSFKEYVDDLRLLRSRQLLSKTDLPIEQIALEVGYENLTSFYRFFKKHVGIAPGEYRNSSFDEKNAKS